MRNNSAVTETSRIIFPDCTLPFRRLKKKDALLNICRILYFILSSHSKSYIISMATTRIAIIGGGAAGFFLAANIRKSNPDTQIIIFEKAAKVLAKVKISGGGRCNLTNSFTGIKDLVHAYPRGHRLIKKLFKSFDYEDTYQWFEDRGVRLTTQEDQCVFPVSQDSESIILCLKREAQRNGVEIRTGHEVNRMERLENGTFRLSFHSADIPPFYADRVAITSGGAPLPKNLHFLQEVAHETEAPVPSLYTFNIKNEAAHQLMGIVVEEATAWIPGTKFKSQGALLFTHWGMSGPAILKLSSYAARWIHENNYRFPLQICWIEENNTERVTEELKNIQNQHAQKQLASIRPYQLPQRLWNYLIEKSGTAPDKKWGETGKKSINRLVTLLTSDTYEVSGKGSFRDEFVTCGGISLNAVSHQTLESKRYPGLFFAGEVLDIDAITGGFNLQAAWTTAYTVAQHIGRTNPE